MKFDELNLIEPILRAVKDEGYDEPSPIQQKAIPPAMSGKDVLGCAQTGTGKTAAFAIPILQRLTNGMSVRIAKSDTFKTVKNTRVIRALILTPTRELALQIADSFKAYGHYLRLHTAVIFGGVSQNPQVDEIRRGVDILVATPGRLNDLIGQGVINLSDVETLVLDEADRMLDMGFIHDVEKIISRVPNQRQTLFFSATMPDGIMRLCDKILTDPIKVAVTPVSSTVEVIDQSLYFVDKVNKRHLLVKLLEDPKVVSALVFTFTKHGADRVVRELEKANIAAKAIHGNKSQNARQSALGAFKRGEIRVLVATDIAARGIDIEELSHVFNYDLPNIPETYVHRIGRTGRAGLGGTAVSFCCIEEMDNLKDIEKLIGKKIPVVEGHDYPMEVMVAPPKEVRQSRSYNDRSAERPAQRRPQKPDSGGRTQYAGKAPSRSSSPGKSPSRSTSGGKFASTERKSGGGFQKSSAHRSYHKG